MNEGAGAADQNRDVEVLARPEGQLHDLPLQLRWEVTRRHPYYFVFWRNALLYRRGEMGDERELQMMRFAAHLMLGTIGVSGHPVDPATPFENLDADELDPAFLSGAVLPLTLRATAAMLVNTLPSAELAVIGAIFTNAGSVEYASPGDDELKTAQRQRALARLMQMPSSSLDSYADAPLYFIHLGASQRTILADVETLVRRKKQQRGIQERRVHTSKLPQYLKVWDLREGWADGRYHREREHSLKQIASRLKQPISTVASRYGSAFQMITGHEFTPERWARLVAPLKLSSLFQDAESILSAPIRRWLRSPVPRPVPDSVVTPGSDSTQSDSILEQAVCVRDDLDFRDLVIDIEELGSQGLANQAIAERLECDIAIVEYLRERGEDFSRSR